MNQVVYGNNTYTLFRDRLVEGDRTAYTANRGGWPALWNAHAEMVRPFLAGAYPGIKSDVPMVDMLYQIALFDLESCNVRDAYFKISPDFFPVWVFTRDISYSSYLGANYAMPSLIRRHLDLTREIRRNIGFKCTEKTVLPYDGVENEVLDMDMIDFSVKYRSHPFSKRTDDICWILGFWDVLMSGGFERADLARLVSDFKDFDRRFYERMRDPADGLYYGQSSFIDAGGTGYPTDVNHGESLCLKALSTTCLYVAAFDRLAQACRYLKDESKADVFDARAENMRIAIRENFQHPDGYFAYLKHPDGRLEPRREQLGMAFLVLFDIVGPELYGAVLDDYPQNDYGHPEFWPFYGYDKVYHDNALWPFADMLYNLAVFKAYRKQETLLQALGSLSRHALWGSFNEVLDYESGGWHFKHARSYIWSASAYLGIVFKMILGVNNEDLETVSFNPFLPEQLGDQFSISDLEIGGMRLDIEINGNGDQVGAFVMDGQEMGEGVMKKDREKHRVIISLV